MPGINNVYYLSADRKTFKHVADDLVKPNGIIGSIDGKLYVADIEDRKLWAYTINEVILAKKAFVKWDQTV